MKKTKDTSIDIQGTSVRVLSGKDEDYISLTDMLKAKDGDFFISDWLRNRNTVEFLGIWESVFNPVFNYGEFATIKSQAGLNRVNQTLTGRNRQLAERYTILLPMMGDEMNVPAGRVDQNLKAMGFVWN